MAEVQLEHFHTRVTSCIDGLHAEVIKPMLDSTGRHKVARITLDQLAFNQCLIAHISLGK